MEDWIGMIIKDYGAFGILLIILTIWLCNKYIKPLLSGDDGKKSSGNGTSGVSVNASSSNDNDNSSNNSNVITVNANGENGVYSKEDLIYDAVRDLQKTVVDNNNRLNNLDGRLDEIKEDFDNQITYLETRINQMPVENIVAAFNEADRIKAENEQKMFLDNLRLGEQADKLLLAYTEKINCTHIFVGSFHNGSGSLTGNPYFKFDIIKEQYHPIDIQPNDHPFEPVYRECQLSMLGKLPLALINNKMLYFVLDENDDSEMEKYDNIIINRMRGMGIKQIALHVCYDDDMVSGFVACVKYDNEPMNLEELKICVQKLELIYKRNKSNSSLF